MSFILFWANICLILSDICDVQLSHNKIPSSFSNFSSILVAFTNGINFLVIHSWKISLVAYPVSEYLIIISVSFLNPWEYTSGSIVFLVLISTGVRTSPAADMQPKIVCNLDALFTLWVILLLSDWSGTITFLHFLSIHWAQPTSSAL